MILPEAWPQRDAFLQAVRRVLGELPDRPAYYPGAEDRLEAACAAYPETAERIGASGARALIADVPPDDAYAFTEEFFAGALAVTSLPGGAPEAAGDWLDRAVDFCNDEVVGTLGITILIHPRTLKDLGDRFWDAIARLRYGTIGVNAWSGVGFLLAQGAWGAFPGHERQDIQSGSASSTMRSSSRARRRPSCRVRSRRFHARSFSARPTRRPSRCGFVTNETPRRRRVASRTSPQVRARSSCPAFFLRRCGGEPLAG